MASLFDTLYITIFNHYKKALGKKSIKLALLYINALQISVILALAAFFMAFAKQMKMPIMSSTKFWVLFTLLSIFVISMNWMRFNGKKRNILNAKLKRNDTSIFLIWLLPLGCFILALILLQVQ